jgi:hypothetical protein
MYSTERGYNTYKTVPLLPSSSTSKIPILDPGRRIYIGGLWSRQLQSYDSMADPHDQRELP